MAYKVLIADDQKMVRQMFELAVRSSENYEIAALAATPEEAVEKAPHLYCACGRIAAIVFGTSIRREKNQNVKMTFCFFSTRFATSFVLKKRHF